MSDTKIDINETELIDVTKTAEVMEKYEKESRMRKYDMQALTKIIFGICLFFTIYHLAYASGIRAMQMVNIKHHAIHVGMVLVLGFACYPAFKKSNRRVIPWYDWICIAFSGFMPVFVFMRYPMWTSTGFYPETIDLVMGTILIFLVLECSRRICGLALSILSIAFLIYGIFGRSFPGVFMHRGYSWDRIVSYLTTDTTGIYGSSIQVSATYIVLFIIFGEIMNKCGMGQFFNDIANSLAGHTKGGPAKVAVLASGFLGSINGSAVANVVTTGAFTIPLMKKTGYSKEFAGAVEATASVGGQLLPPIMGAAAFVMAETLGVQYPVVIKAAVIPALIYYLGIILQVQMRAEKENLEGIPKDQLPKTGEVMKKQGHLMIPIVFLLYMLIFSGKTVLLSAFWTILMTIIVAQLRPISRMSLMDICDAFVAGAKSTVSVAIACACVGIVVGVCSQTGFALNVASTIIRIGQSSIFLTLIFTMITCMILGMGLPSIPAYLITATIAAPALIQLGVPAIAAHLFCFYFAMFANLTPPVALASFAAAGLSGGSPMKTGVISVKLALAGFIVPYMFVFNEQLILENVTWLSGSLVVVTSCIGVFLIALFAEGFFMTKANWFIRVVAFVSAMLLIDSAPISDAIGFVVCVAIILFLKRKHKKEELQKVAVS
ncbi:TRAP transporter permease [Chakrabartyella piscis]|uniref:TRAP transporter permease n=1 Tax=Chakrabartyella piscis TaxID=2918914 RepID=UPI0029583848|nr:TRAP transporter permease [Chakrabartyella piscis]